MQRVVRYRQRWLLSIVLFALLLAGGLWWQAADARSWHDVGLVDPLWAETPFAVNVDGQSMFLAISAGEVVAWNRQDTHPKGCIVGWDVHEERFIDPCLGTAYSRTGQYIRGPSPRSLDRFSVRVVENAVAVDTSTIIRGAPLNSLTLWERIQRWFENL